ncbi:hypothetical protein MRX96_003014 [Rhipicephalus microplus]
MEIQVQGTAIHPDQYDPRDWNPSTQSPGMPTGNTKNDPQYARRSFCARDAESVAGDARVRPSSRATELIAAAARSSYNCTKDQASITPSTRRISSGWYSTPREALTLRRCSHATSLPLSWRPLS